MKSILAFALVVTFAFSGATETRAASSVARFEALVVPALAPSKLVWAKATATGPTSLVLSDVVLTQPIGTAGHMRTVLHATRLTIEDIDFDGLERGEAPARLRAHVDGVRANPKAFLFSQMLTSALGVEEYRANARIDYRAADGSRLKLDDFVLDFPGLARFSFHVDLRKLEPLGPKLNEASFDTLALEDGTLDYEDHSLLAKIVAESAREQQVSEPIVLGEWGAGLAAFSLQSGSNGGQLLGVLLSYLKDYRAPRGPLRISLHPNQADGQEVPMSALFSAGNLQNLGATASYGARN
jgi:hypothetical protein